MRKLKENFAHFLHQSKKENIPAFSLHFHLQSARKQHLRNIKQVCSGIISLLQQGFLKVENCGMSSRVQDVGWTPETVSSAVGPDSAYSWIVGSQRAEGCADCFTCRVTASGGGGVYQRPPPGQDGTTRSNN